MGMAAQCDNSSAALQLTIRPTTVKTETSVPTTEVPPTVKPIDTPVPIGGFIELHIQSGHNRLWTVVQWQGDRSSWYTVEGWQSTPDENNQMKWWVAKPDLGKGPFRWLVYQNRNGKLLATSESFYLPRYSGAVTRVNVTLR
jgi:hypothetical protein